MFPKGLGTVFICEDIAKMGNFIEEINSSNIFFFVNDEDFSHIDTANTRKKIIRIVDLNDCNHRIKKDDVLVFVNVSEDMFDIALSLIETGISLFLVFQENIEYDEFYRCIVSKTTYTEEEVKSHIPVFIKT